MPNDKGQCFCEKEQKWAREINFYTYKDGSKAKMCKQCLTMHIDNFNPETFLWLLKEFNVPYIPEEWNVLRDKAFAKDPKKMNGMSVFGKYLSKMKLKQWMNYSWEDTETLAAQRAQIRRNQEDEYKEFLERTENDLKEKLASGEINEAEYKTLMPTPIQNQDLQATAAEDMYSEKYFPEDNYLKVDLPDPSKDLTQDDKTYLVMKWGKLYTADELLTLEQDYNNMINSFDIQDADTKNALVIICKLNLKANQALDSGDYDGFKKLSSELGNQRKLANFAAAARKRDQKGSGFVDSIGEIVAYCEKNGGQIPRMDINEPLDKVDVIIQDLKDYTRELIYQDTALASQIEDYLKRREILEQQKKDKADAKEKGFDTYQLTDEDLVAFEEMRRQQIAEDAEHMRQGSDE